MAFLVFSGSQGCGSLTAVLLSYTIVMLDLANEFLHPLLIHGVLRFTILLKVATYNGTVGKDKLLLCSFRNHTCADNQREISPNSTERLNILQIGADTSSLACDNDGIASLHTQLQILLQTSSGAVGLIFEPDTAQQEDVPIPTHGFQFFQEGLLVAGFQMTADGIHLHKFRPIFPGQVKGHLREPQHIDAINLIRISK